MHDSIANICEILLVRWQTATLHDFAHLLLAVVLVGWACTRTRG